MEPQLSFTLVPSADDGKLFSAEYQSALREFERQLKADGIKASQRWFAMDSVGAVGGGTGAFTILVTVLGPVAIVQLRKAVETFLKVKEGRKLKVKIGSITVEGTATEVEKLISPEMLTKALETTSSKTKHHE